MGRAVFYQQSRRGYPGIIPGNPECSPVDL